ncbi:DNA adenine methylase [Pseudovibrio denitrificans]|uniref:DNA adenine methylase n=1 Tax=Pseudovibrio denitrificans TaxID=258256 RepID=UPI0039BFDFE4
MPIAVSPLRYPGGKTCLLSVVADILRRNGLVGKPYVEPFAGGAGLALSLLFEDCVSEIHINDIDEGIWAFWESVLHNTDAFIDRMLSTPIDMNEWHRQSAILNDATSSVLDLGFAVFFLNRTNRSGIIKNAGPIGGKTQAGNYKLDCRFNKDTLLRRISKVAEFREKIFLTKEDAREFVTAKENQLPKDSFFCIDPPYFQKGSSLYTSFYKPEDHKQLAQSILDLQSNWIITYDNVPDIRELYSSRRQYQFDLNYSVQVKRVGKEVMVASKGLRLPEVIKEGMIHQPRVQV